MSGDGYTTPPVKTEPTSPPPIRRNATNYIQPSIPTEEPTEFTLGPAHTSPRGVHNVLILPPATQVEPFSNLPTVTTVFTPN